MFLREGVPQRTGGSRDGNTIWSYLLARNSPKQLSTLEELKEKNHQASHDTFNSLEYQR